jgi:tensin
MRGQILNFQPIRGRILQCSANEKSRLLFSGQGITLTDQARRLFFRKHFPAAQISHCGLDPEDRRWSLKKHAASAAADATDGEEAALAARLFAFVARRPTQAGCNQCHVFAELDPDQPARAIVNFVNKLMLNGSNGATATAAAHLRPSDMV